MRQRSGSAGAFASPASPPFVAPSLRIAATGALDVVNMVFLADPECLPASSGRYSTLTLPAFTIAPHFWTSFFM